MKKALLLLLATFAISAYAQNSDDDLYYKGIESNKELNLTNDQIAKIKKLNREIGPQFREIGQSNISGYEKGQKKKALALKHKEEILKVLTPEQQAKWEQHHGKLSLDEGIKNIMTANYDDKLKALEEKYDHEKELVENNGLYNKKEKKEKLEALKKNYKEAKKQLKDQKNTVKESQLLR